MDITDNNSPPGVVTMAMIAARCGVHYSTVQRALTGQGRVGKATIARIQAVAAEMGYDPLANQAASRLIMLRHGKRIVNRVIALYLPPTYYHTNYYMRILTGLAEVFTQEHFDLLTTYNNGNYHEATPPIPHSITSGNVDAVISAISVEHSLALIRDIRATPRFGSRPIISLFEAVPGESSVTVDDYSGAYALCTHLLRQGHRHLLYPNGGVARLNIRERVHGCLDAFTHAGLSAKRYLHHMTIDRAFIPWEQHMFEIIQSGLAAYPDTTAILLPYDALAEAARGALRRLGKQAPEDIGLVGFDDTDPLRDAHGRNILTTVHLPLEELGRTAARMAVKQVLYPTPAVASVALPVNLVVRRSSLPLASPTA